MSTIMKHITEHKIENLFDNTVKILKNARTTLEVKANLLDFVDSDPTDIQIEILEYGHSIDILGSLIREDVIVDEDAFNIIYCLVDKYRIYVENEYPATGKFISLYLLKLDEHYSVRFDN